MKKKILIITAAICIAATVPVLARGGHGGGYGGYGYRENCVNSTACARVCSECGGSLYRGVCQNCGSDQRLYQNAQYPNCGGYGCRR